MLIRTAPNLTHTMVFLEVIYKVYHITNNNRSDLLIETTPNLTQMVVCCSSDRQVDPRKMNASNSIVAGVWRVQIGSHAGLTLDARIRNKHYHYGPYITLLST